MNVIMLHKFIERIIMKSNLLLVSLLAVAASVIYGCNSGSSSSSSPAAVYIPAGTYTSTLSNMVPVGSTSAADCTQLESSNVVTVNSSGEVCDSSGDCSPAVNVSANPCYTNTIQTTYGNITVSATATYSNCALSSANVFTSALSLSVSGAGQSLSCTGTATMTPLVTGQ